MNNNDTIFALSSAAGKSGVAVVRISGDDLHDFMCRITGRTEIQARHAYFVNLRDEDGELIDQCLAIYFRAPNSFTGQDVVEIHSHGAPAVIEKIFDFLATQNMRMATRGEFSRRAFYSGKMDLADVDGLAALLDAQTDRQRKMALRSMTGGDSDVYAHWRADMIEIAAYSAAILDYVDDELPPNIGEKITARVKKLRDEIAAALARYGAVRALRHGFNIALVGETNVGKSSLFNVLVGANRAIVSDIAGTTRDVVSSMLDIDGYMVNLADTAGLRDTTDEIEKIGIERTRAEIESADLVIRVYNANPANVHAATNEIIVVNKSDLITDKSCAGVIYTSAKTGDGMDTLLNEIRRRMHELMGNMESAVAVNTRTRALLNDAVHELDAAITAGDNYDIFAEHVRAAADNIGKILGAITAAEVMDATFSQLCLGK